MLCVARVEVSDQRQLHVRPGVRVIGKPLWPAYRVVGKRFALVSKSAGQRTKGILGVFWLTNKIARSMG